MRRVKKKYQLAGSVLPEYNPNPSYGPNDPVGIKGLLGMFQESSCPEGHYFSETEQKCVPDLMAASRELFAKENSVVGEDVLENQISPLTPVIKYANIATRHFAEKARQNRQGDYYKNNVANPYSGILGYNDGLSESSKYGAVSYQDGGEVDFFTQFMKDDDIGYELMYGEKKEEDVSPEIQRLYEQGMPNISDFNGDADTYKSSIVEWVKKQEKIDPSFDEDKAVWNEIDEYMKKSQIKENYRPRLNEEENTESISFSSSGKYGTKNIGVYGKQIGNTVANMLGYAPAFNSIYRDPEQQAYYVGKGIGAKNSRHLTGDAVDLKPADWNNLSNEQQFELRSKYKVLYHNNHYHIEPKQDGGFINKTGYTPNTKSYNNPYNIIPSGNITMEKTPFPVLGVDDLGNKQLMYPGNNYKFPGNNVLEIPLNKFQEGGSPERENKSIEFIPKPPIITRLRNGKFKAIFNDEIPPALMPYLNSIKRRGSQLKVRGQFKKEYFDDPSLKEDYVPELPYKIMQKGGLTPAEKQLNQTIVPNNYGMYNGVVEYSGRQKSRPTELEAMKTMIEYMKNNQSDQSSDPSNIYHPQFRHYGYNALNAKPLVIAQEGGIQKYLDEMLENKIVSDQTPIQYYDPKKIIVPDNRTFLSSASFQDNNTKKLNLLKKKQFVNKNSNAKLVNGEITTKNPDRKLDGSAIPYTNAARIDKGIETMFNGIEAAGIVAPLYSGTKALIGNQVKNIVKQSLKSPKPIIFDNTGLNSLRFDLMKEHLDKQILRMNTDPIAKAKLKEFGLKGDVIKPKLENYQFDPTAAEIGKDGLKININTYELDRINKNNFNISDEAVLDHELAHILQYLKFFENSNVKKIYENSNVPLHTSFRKTPNFSMNEYKKLERYYDKIANRDAPHYFPILKENMDKNALGNLDYYKKAKEGFPIRTETRRDMILQNFLKDENDLITHQNLSAFFKQNPKNRLATFLEKPTIDLVSLMNKVPKFIAPVAGAALIKEKKGGKIPCLRCGGNIKHYKK